LPDFLSFNTTTCEISVGSSGSAMTSAYTITATNSLGSSNLSIDLSAFEPANGAAPNISSTPVNYYFVTANAPAINVINTGGAITGCLIAPTAPATFALPSSLSFNKTTCQISAASVDFPLRSNYTVTATNGQGMTSSVDITIAAFFSQDSASANSVCWYNASNIFKCWGDNVSGQLGLGNETPAITAPTVPSSSSMQTSNAVIHSVSYGVSGDAGETHDSLGNARCVLVAGDSFYCAGSLFWKTSQPKSSVFTSMGGLPSETAASLSMSPYSFSVINSAGTVFSWGMGGKAADDQPNLAPAKGPTGSTYTLSSGVVQLSSGYGHSCFLLRDGSVSCLGAITPNNGSFLKTTIAKTPTSMPGVSSGIQLGSNLSSTCAVQRTGAVACMGNNQLVPFGAAGKDSFLKFVVNSNFSSGVVQVVGCGPGFLTLGAYCALLSSGTVSCWGTNGQGELGQGTVSTGLVGQATGVPTPVNVSGVIGLQAFGGGFCALLQSGSLTCWGGIYSGFNSPTLTSFSIP
jgi:alpha-tubulin suppressor-like RCC1 family protein